MVENRQRQRLEHYTFSEAAGYRKHRRAREIQLTLGVPVDIAAEPKIAQVSHGVHIEELRQRFARHVVEPELGQRLQEPSCPGHHAVSASVRQPTSEQLERGPAVRGAVAQRRRQHGQLVPVGQQPGVNRVVHAATVSVARTRLGILAPMVASAPTKPGTTGQREADSVEATAAPWVTIVWADPVNLMNYVTYVFQKLFGYSEPHATKLMLQGHNEGKAVGSAGSRESMEVAGTKLHAAGWGDTMQQDTECVNGSGLRPPR